MTRRRVPSLRVLTFYSALPSEAQRLAMSKSDTQQCIVSTSVAEASVMIPGVVYVIGMIPSPIEDPRRGEREEGQV